MFIDSKPHIFTLYDVILYFRYWRTLSSCKQTNKKTKKQVSDIKKVSDFHVSDRTEVIPSTALLLLEIQVLHTHSVAVWWRYQQTVLASSNNYADPLLANRPSCDLPVKH